MFNILMIIPLSYNTMKLQYMLFLKYEKYVIINNKILNILFNITFELSRLHVLQIFV